MVSLCRQLGTIDFKERCFSQNFSERLGPPSRKGENADCECENGMLRGIFGHKREDWRKLHNQKLQSLFSSPNVIRVTKSRRMRLAGRVARMKD
jgi:hypothetical protein